ncbi:hypothetical protein B0H17DRAFT_1130739 [Mycena rosella]|uniref:Uncharacterized protein n=1 Tax=Mycena rosella TaxID=1033263 RepID=A0AAD7DQH4_MYCRO|nr:hypothetical protein B0H17DRAFT_1130739 [Mycena rosella]
MQIKFENRLRTDPQNRPKTDYLEPQLPIWNAFAGNVRGGGGREDLGRDRSVTRLKLFYRVSRVQRCKLKLSTSHDHVVSRDKLPLVLKRSSLINQILLSDGRIVGWREVPLSRIGLKALCIRTSHTFSSSPLEGINIQAKNILMDPFESAGDVNNLGEEAREVKFEDIEFGSFEDTPSGNFQDDIETPGLPQLLRKANEHGQAQQATSDVIAEYFTRGDHVVRGYSSADLEGCLKLASQLRHYRLVDVVECAYIQKLQVKARELDVQLNDLVAYRPVGTTEWKVLLDARAANTIAVLNGFQREIDQLKKTIKSIAAMWSGFSAGVNFGKEFKRGSRIMRLASQKIIEGDLRPYNRDAQTEAVTLHLVRGARRIERSAGAGTRDHYGTGLRGGSGVMNFVVEDDGVDR